MWLLFVDHLLWLSVSIGYDLLVNISKVNSSPHSVKNYLPQILVDID